MTLTYHLCGRRGTWWHPRCFCVVGAALTALAGQFALLWLLKVPTCSQPRRLGGLRRFSTWCSFVIHSFVTHNSFTLIRNSFTHTHNFLTHTTLSHATLSHTTLSHNFLAHNSFTYNFLKLAILHHLLCLSCLLCFASITVSDYLEKLTCGFVRSFNFILQWSGTWEVPETCYDFCPGPWHCFRAPGEISGVPGHSCQRGAVISCHQSRFAPRGGHAIGRFGESARASAHFPDVAGTWFYPVNFWGLDWSPARRPRRAHFFRSSKENPSRPSVRFSIVEPEKLVI